MSALTSDTRREETLSHPKPSAILSAAALPRPLPARSQLAPLAAHSLSHGSPHPSLRSACSTLAETFCMSRSSLPRYKNYMALCVDVIVGVSMGLCASSA